MIKMYKIMIMILYECIKDIIEWIINSHLLKIQNIFIVPITIIFLI